MDKMGYIVYLMTHRAVFLRRCEGTSGEHLKSVNPIQDQPYLQDGGGDTVHLIIDL